MRAEELARRRCAGLSSFFIHHTDMIPCARASLSMR